MKNFYTILCMLFAVSLSYGQKAQIDLPITWNDSANVNYTTAAFGGTASSLIGEPNNVSNLILSVTKPDTAAGWAGVTLSPPAPATTGLGSAIPFAANANLIKVRFYSPDAGITVRLKAEDAGNNQITVETEATTTVANAWDTLTFDFSNQATGTAAINYANSYNMVSLFPNFGVDGPTAGAKTYYVDDVWFSAGGGGGNPTGTQVTFKVDLSDYTGNDTAVFVNGTFNNWCGTCNPMTDANNDDIWELNVNLPDDSIEFKYTVNGAAYEAFVGGESCTKTTGAFTNRFLILDQDTVLPVTCFASCSACTGTPTSAQVTFKIDMNAYPDTFTTAYVNGTFNGWCGTCTPMTDADSDGVWEATVGFAYQDTIDFKYTLNGWQFEETLTSGPCTRTDGNFTNRHLKIMGDTTMPVMCWEECVSCDQVGFAEINNIQEFKVMPNPTSGVFTVSMISDAVAKLNLNVYNMAGQKVYQMSEETAQLNEVIDLGGLNNGVYLIELSNSSSTMLKKLVLSK